MAATPTVEQIKAIRGDIETYLQGDKALSNYADRALAQLKRDLEDIRNIQWSQVYASDAYLDNPDGTGRNEDRCKHLMCLLSIAYVFEDYALAVNGGQWWDLYLAYRADYDAALKIARLDVDLDESGGIDDDEAFPSSQSFMVR